MPVKAAVPASAEAVRHPPERNRAMQPRILPALLATAIGLALASPRAHADDPKPLSFEWNLRARAEHVDDAAFARDADAVTARLRAGLRAKFATHWSALLEAEAIGALDDDYNSGANGRTQYPAVIDPTGVELNQLWLARQTDTLLVRLGRQRLALDNQRWLGASGWRQNEQTFDALAVEWKPAAKWTLRYDGLAKVHRVNGDDARDPLARERDLSSHFLNATRATPRQQWTGYTYLHEDRDVHAASTLTYGLRWHGDTANAERRWGATLEAARQFDYAENPLDFAHSYWLVEPTLGLDKTTLRAGWEHLGGNGAHALQTPLATLHAFDGWADRFLATPNNGLEDRYLGAAGKAGKFAWNVSWHDFRADTSAGRYGREWNASLSRPLRKGVDAMLKFADFSGAGPVRDVTKVWLQVEWTGAH
jgi:hypothetical protein